MWMVSGSLFPMATAHGWVNPSCGVNPLTYSIALLNHTLRLPYAAPGALVSLVVTAAFGLGVIAGIGPDGRAEERKKRGTRLNPEVGGLVSGHGFRRAAVPGHPDA